MKHWEPEEVFESADFPVKKQPDSDAQKSQPAPGQQPPKPRPWQPPRHNQAQGDVQPPKPVRRVQRPPYADRARSQRPGVPESWEPDLDFERADFSGVAPEDAGGGGDLRSSSNAMADFGGRRGAGSEPTGTAGVAGPEARVWQPPRVGDAVQSNANVKSGDAGAQTPRIVGAKPDASASPAAGGAGTAASGYTRRILQELTIQHRESARHILRHWYWEKAGMAPEGLGHIQPRDRIYIILAGLGPKVLVVLYESMSPTERRQMQEILDRPPNVTTTDMHRVQSVFMTLLRSDL